MNALDAAVPISVALITAAGASLAGIVQLVKLRRENNEQHSSSLQRIQESHELLTSIHDDVREVRSDVKQVRSDLDKHLGEHEASKTFRRVK